MASHTMKLGNIPFEKIMNGTKVIESRLYDEKRQDIVVGDEIIFSQDDEPTKKISTIVVALYHEESFRVLFSKFPSSEFGGDSQDFLLQEINQFYSKEDEDVYGVIGIRIKRTL